MNDSESISSENENEETGNLRNEESKTLSLLKGTVHVSYYDNSTKLFKEFTTVGILVDSYIALIPSGGFTEEMNITSTQVKFMSTKKEDSKLSSDYISKRLLPLNYKSKVPKSLSKINWGLIALSNPIGDYLFDSHFEEGKYCHFSPFEHFLESLQVNPRPLSLITITSNLIEDDNDDEVKKDSSVLSIHSESRNESIKSSEEEFMTLPLSTLYYLDEATKKYYFFILYQTQKWKLNHEGIIIDTSQRIYGIYKANNFISTEEFAKKFKKNLETLTNSTNSILQVITIDIFSETDLADFYLTKKLIVQENSSIISNTTYSQAVYDKIANQINLCPNKAIAAQSLISSGDSLIRRMENIHQTNLKKYDQDLIVRKLLLYNLDPLHNVSLDSKKFTGNYFTTVMNYLYFNHSLIELNLSHTQLEESLMSQFGIVLFKSTSLQTIILSHTSLSLTGLFILVCALKQNKYSNIEKIDLSYNTFKSNQPGGAKINVFFKPVKSDFQQDDILFLADIFFLPRIKCLRLDHIVNFKESEELTSVFNAVYKGLQSKSISRIQTLDLSGADLSTTQVMNSLTQCLLMFDSLKNLIMKECGITDRAIGTLAAFMIKNKRIYPQLDLSSNLLSEDSSVAFNQLFKTYNAIMTKFIEDNANVKSLPQYQICLNSNIELNRHKPQSQNRRGFMYEEMKFSLPTVLELANTNMDADSLTALANAFKLNSNLKITKLNLACNNITDEILKASDLSSAIKNNSHINTLFIHLNQIESKDTVISMINTNKKGFLMVIDYISGFDIQTIDYLKNLKFYYKSSKRKNSLII